MSTKTNHYDILVIGGGPAGTTIASLLAEKNHKVCLLEKAQHPRFHIGESLLPMNMPILEKLGVLAEIDAIGLKKYAAEFNSLETPLAQDSFYFSKATQAEYPYAYEVKRSEFDTILFKNCQKKGVTALENMTVRQVELNQPIKKLLALSKHGEEHSFSSRYIIDASGRNTVLARQLDSKKKNPHHNMTALYGHFSSVKRRLAKDEGNISIYWFQYGWVWLIPLKEGITSIGCVCCPDYFKNRTTELNDFLIQTLQTIPELNTRIKDAHLEGDTQITGNYSYHSEIMSGEGYLLIGDAYAFVDPVFSSGVYLAMQSAVRGADLVNQLLTSANNHKRLMKQFERSVNEEIKAFCWFIYRFNSPALHKLLMSSDETAQHPIKQALKSAVISVLSGNAYNNKHIKLPLRVFKLLYLINKLAEWKKNSVFFRFKKRQNTL